MTTFQKVLYWAPRVLSLCFVLFLSLFALDAFSGGPWWVMLGAFLMHLVPALLLLGAVAIAWRHEWFGALVFLGFAAWYVYAAGLDRPWSWYASIALPSAIVGVFFLASWFKKETRTE